MTSLFARLAKWWNAPGQRILDPASRLLELEGFRPAGYACGIEVLNDEATPIEFVIEALERHAGLSNKDAAQLTFRIHLEGGALLPLASEDEATRVAAAITAMARERGVALVCRAACVPSAGEASSVHSPPDSRNSP
jgi:ATP-dependent Clp protease adapter protein ClpS